MPRKSTADLTLGGPRFGRVQQNAVHGTLVWHHTEFGRVTAGGDYRIVSAGGQWQLLDRDWNAYALPGTMVEMMEIAERLVERAKAKQR